jgi:hypothetical protein
VVGLARWGPRPGGSGALVELFQFPTLEARPESPLREPATDVLVNRHVKSSVRDQGIDDRARADRDIHRVHSRVVVHFLSYLTVFPLKKI